MKAVIRPHPTFTPETLHMHRSSIAAVILLVVAACASQSDFPTTDSAALSANSQIGINVLLKTDVTDAIVADLNSRGHVRDVVTEIRAIDMQIASGDLASI